QIVTVRSEEKTFEQSYGKLLIATGAHAVSEPIEGSSLDGVFTMHHMDAAGALRAYLMPPSMVDAATFDGKYIDRDRVETYADKKPPESAAVVGGGYVGVEMAEALRAHDLDVHLFQRPEQLLPPFGSAVGDHVAETLQNHEVAVHLGSEVEAMIGEDHVAGVRFDGSQIQTDLVLLGIGIRPNTELIQETAIKCGDSGAIMTDKFGRTNVDDIYAAGDCAEMRHTVTGELTWVPLGLTANRAGRAIGNTVAGSPTPVGDIAGTAVVKAFETECGRTGILDLDKARSTGFDPISKTITASSRSGYYPGAEDTTVTLVADQTSGQLLGGSIVGADRAAIRIDTIATALENEMTVDELERSDLAYAPPFSPVWDPILVAAKVLNGALTE
ncbi:MAG: FAD-dependent oxidoreductase, partial [Halobacteriaceae archaeon]